MFESITSGFHTTERSPTLGVTQDKHAQQKAVTSAESAQALQVPSEGNC